MHLEEVQEVPSTEPQLDDIIEQNTQAETETETDADADAGSETKTVESDPVQGPQLPNTLNEFLAGDAEVRFPPVFTHHTCKNVLAGGTPTFIKNISEHLPYGPAAPIFISREYYDKHLLETADWANRCLGRLLMPEEYSAAHLARLYEMYLEEIAPTSRLFLAGFAPDCAQFLQAVCANRLSKQLVDDAVAAYAIGPLVLEARAELGSNATDEELYDAIKEKLNVQDTVNE